MVTDLSQATLQTVMIGIGLLAETSLLVKSATWRAGESHCGNP